MSSNEHQQAKDALQGVADAKRHVAKSFTPPWWHDPVLGLLLAMLVVHHAAPMPFYILIVAIGVIGIALITRHYTSQEIWVDGWRTGKTLPYTIAFAVIYLIIYGGNAALYHLFGVTWIVPVAAILMFVLTIVFGKVWMHVWRKEMNSDDA
ncbi:MAG: hypothetical protein JJU10_10260 [Idiomarina sp.]|nr:hypothetical protein [Idiomarina sp.]